MARNRSPRRHVPALLTLLCLCATARADELSSSYTIPDQTTEWALPATLERFDPSLGVLTGIRLTVEASQISDLRFENNDSQPSDISIQLSTNVSVRRSPQAPMCPMPVDCNACEECLVTVPLQTEVLDVHVSAFDGNNGNGPFMPDFAGASGRSFEDLTDTNSVSVVYAPPTEDAIALFVGPAGNPGTVSLGVRAGGICTANGSANLISQCSNSAGAVVTVTYSFEPDCDNNGVPDGEDIAAGAGDCDGDGLPDNCDDPCPTCNEISRRQPASLLLYPEFDNRAGVQTVLTVTNTHPTESVNVHFIYIGKYGRTGELDCEEFDRTEELTPNDTLSVFTLYHNPNHQAGFVFAYAVDEDGEAISFDYLIGHLLAVNGLESFQYAVDPLDFRAIPDEGEPTDADMDDVRDLDGIEYEQAPDEILIPRFVGQNSRFTGKLIFIGLSGGAMFHTTAGLYIYNDDEEAFSANFTFRCWEKVDAVAVSNAFKADFLEYSTSQNTYESLAGFEYGWVRIFGVVANSYAFSIEDPAVYAVWVEINSRNAAADLPFEFCGQNGALWPRSVSGE